MTSQDSQLVERKRRTRFAIRERSLLRPKLAQGCRSARRVYGRQQIEYSGPWRDASSNAFLAHKGKPSDHLCRSNFTWLALVSRRSGVDGSRAESCEALIGSADAKLFVGCFAKRKGNGGASNGR